MKILPLHVQLSHCTTLDTVLPIRLHKHIQNARDAEGDIVTANTNHSLQFPTDFQLKSPCITSQGYWRLNHAIFLSLTLSMRAHLIYGINCKGVAEYTQKCIDRSLISSALLLNGCRLVEGKSGLKLSSAIACRAVIDIIMTSNSPKVKFHLSFALNWKL